MITILKLIVKNQVDTKCNFFRSQKQPLQLSKKKYTESGWTHIALLSHYTHYIWDRDPWFAENVFPAIYKQAIERAFERFSRVANKNSAAFLKCLLS